MAAKVDPARRRAFLKALAETGNATLAAERAGVSRSWAAKLRLADPAFDTACRAALAQAGARLAASTSNRPVAAWRSADGVELVVRGTGSRRPRIVRSAERQWTARTERRFLDALRATRNLRLACAEAGMSEPSLLTHRRRWPDFERRLKAVLADGGERLRAEAAARRERPIEPAELADEPWPATYSVDEAIRVLRRHRG